MTNQNPSAERDPGSGLPPEVDPEATGTGDNLSQAPEDQVSTAGYREAGDPGSGLPAEVDPGTIDLDNH